jgi:hypothetical protein
MLARALIASVLVTATAHAEDWDAAYAFGANLETVGGDGYAGMLLHVNVARRLTRRIALGGTLEFASATSGDGTDGEIEGGVVRGLAGVDFHLLASQEAFVPNLVASIGTGTETIMWDRGTLTRALSYVGFEYRTSFHIAKGGFVRGLDTLGFHLGVRAHVAPGPTSTRIAKLCTSCDPEEPDRGIDVGLAIYMGLLFGR